MANLWPDTSKLITTSGHLFCYDSNDSTHMHETHCIMNMNLAWGVIKVFIVITVAFYSFFHLSTSTSMFIIYSFYLVDD